MVSGDMVGLGDGEGAAAVGRALGRRHSSTASVVAEAWKQGTFAAKSTSSVGGAAAS